MKKEHARICLVASLLESST